MIPQFPPRSVQTPTTTRAAPERLWLSGHLFVPKAVFGDAGDSVLLKVAPLIHQLQSESRINGYFFIRYLDGGPHIRLRLLPSVTADRVCDTVAKYVSQLNSNRGASGRTNSEQANNEATDNLIRLEWIPYVPEWDRYGGPTGVQLAQKFFEASSTAVLNVVRSDGLQGGRRLGQSLLTMLVQLYCCLSDRDEIISFLAKYQTLVQMVKGNRVIHITEHEIDRIFAAQSHALLAHVSETWNRLDRRDEISPPLDAFRLSLDQLVAELKEAWFDGQLVFHGTSHPWADAIRWLMQSHVHMTNNRLGLGRYEESMVAALLRRALRESA